MAEYIKEYLFDFKDLELAIIMANRTGMIINDIKISRMLESSIKAKERFKLIYDAQTFDPSALI